MTRMTRRVPCPTALDIACEKHENRRKRLGRPASTGKETAHE